MIFISYRILLWVLYPFLIIYAMFRITLRKDFIEEHLYKLGMILPNASLNTNNIWIHGVSAGEIASITKLYKIFNDHNYNIILSTTTSNGYEMAKKFYTSANLYYFPYDYPLIWSKWIHRLKPKVVLLVELEIWPCLLNILNRSNIPCVLISGRMGEKEYKRYKYIQSFFKEVLSKINIFIVQSENDQKRISSFNISPQRIFKEGSLKYDIEIPDNPQNPIHQIQSGGGKIIIAGSTHPSEEFIILNSFKSIILNHPEIKLIMAPRHIHRISSIKKITQSLSLSYQTWCDLKNLDGEKRLTKNILLLDSMGDLRYFYKIGDIIILGGTFTKQVGGHNPLEPLYFSKAIITGTHVKSIENIINDLISNNAVIKLVDNDSNLLTHHIEELLNHESYSREMGERGKIYLNTHKGVSERTYNIIEKLLAEK